MSCTAWRSAGCSRQGLAGPLFAVLEVPRVARMYVRALKVAEKHFPEICPATDGVGGQEIQPGADVLSQAYREVLDDEAVVACSSGPACKPIVLQPYTGVRIPVYFTTFAGDRKHWGKGAPWIALEKAFDPEGSKLRLRSRSMSGLQGRPPRRSGEHSALGAYARASSTRAAARSTSAWCLACSWPWITLRTS